MTSAPEPPGELLIEGASVLPSAGGEVFEGGAVLVRDGVVAEVGDSRELAGRFPTAARAGGPGALVMPGLVNAHQHAEGVSTFQLGFVDEPFEPWMALMHALPSVEPYLTTLYKSLLMLTSGVTTHVHSHFPAKGGYGDDPDAYLAELEGSLRAHRAAGLRTAFAPYWRDRASLSYDDDDAFIATLPDDLAAAARTLHPPEIPNSMYADAVRDLHRQLAGDPLIGVQLSIAAPQWASDDLLDVVAATAAELGLHIHMHALESLRQRRWGDRPTAVTSCSGWPSAGCWGRARPSRTASTCATPTSTCWPSGAAWSPTTARRTCGWPAASRRCGGWWRVASPSGWAATT